MTKSIYELQNREDILCALTAQKRLYEKAKKHSAVVRMIVLLNVLIAAIMLKCNDSAVNIATLNLLLVLEFYARVYMENLMVNNTVLAAKIQQFVDGTLYSTVIDGNLSDWNVGIELSNIAEHGENISSDDKKLVMNWYQDYSNLDVFHQIFYCQMENISWDEKIRSRYKWFMHILFVTVLIAVIYYAYANGKSMATMISVLACFIPLINYFANVNHKLNNDIFRLHDIRTRCCVIEKILDDTNCLTKNVGLLIELQNKIFEHRSNAFLIPECFFSLFKNKLNEQAYNNANNVQCLNRCQTIDGSM